MSTKLEDKIKAILAEGSGVPDCVLGVKQTEELKDAKLGLTTSEQNAKITKKYNKDTTQPKIEDDTEYEKPDDKAEEENTKIKEKLIPGKSDKLKEEAFSAMFNGEDLSEEFQLKAKAIFEATVEELVEVKIDELQTEYQLKLDEAVEEVKGELVEQIDAYLDYIIEQWMQDNAIALESGIKVEMVSSFMEGLKNVFEQHYIEVPESKIDVIEKQANQIEELESKLQEAEELAKQAMIEAKILKIEAIIAEVQEGLTAIEAEKLHSLAENIDFKDEEEFKSKIVALKESFFRKAPMVDENITQEKSADVSENKYSEVEAVLMALRQKSNLIRSSN